MKMEEKPEEKKTYAKLYNFTENIELKDIPFIPCDYILRCVDGPYEGRQIRIKDLGDEITIGSESSCNFFLKDDCVSSKHAKLTFIHDTVIYTLEDLESEKGTWQKISCFEDGYEITENTTLKLFQHIFEITNKDGSHILKFFEGSRAKSEYAIEEDSCLMIGKKGTEIELDLECPENHLYKVIKTKGRVFVVNACEENTDGGLFYKLHKGEFSIIRGGDIFQIGKSSFRVLVHNWGIFSEIGDRIHQEDKHCIIDDLRLFDELVVPYYAVYDGHGGVSCSLFLQKHLHHNLRDLIKSKNIAQSKNFFEDLCSTIQEAIIYTDLNYYENENPAIHHGSTCVFLFFIGNKILCCNLGDSISILVKSDKKIYLSRDFRPTREKEKGRIQSRKGYVTSDGRLLGVISVSRGFGDWKFKDSKKKEYIRKAISNKTTDFDEYLISNRAEFRMIDFDPVEDKYIIIVSDGIFQHSPNNNFIYDTINKYLATEKCEYSNLKNIPSVVDNIRLDLINNIYGDPNTKGKADNMTLILIYLQK